MSGGEPAPVPVEVLECPGGPVLVRGATTIQDADGVEHPVTRPVVAVCRCGKSARLPWCDGTHKVVRARADDTQKSGSPLP